jgi:hypothetical protein
MAFLRANCGVAFRVRVAVSSLTPKIEDNLFLNESLCLCVVDEVADTLTVVVSLLQMNCGKSGDDWMALNSQMTRSAWGKWST